MATETADSVDPFRLKQLRLRLDVEDASFPGLKRLKLSGKDLAKLPAEVFQLGELEILNLSPERQSCLYFRLLQIPPDIGKLVNLKVLMLDTNELEELPEEIGQLTRLERLTLSNNLFTALPSSFSKLVQLQSLHLANNQFDPFPQSICSLKKLEFLDISDNRLQELPRDISKLFNLHTLILFINNLKTLPDTICGMTTLHCLWIGNNAITKLPRKFGQLHHLDWGHTGRHMLSAVVDGNPLNDPPLEVCRRGVKAISQYFDDNPTKNSRGGKETPSNVTSDQASPMESRVNQRNRTKGRGNENGYGGGAEQNGAASPGRRKSKGNTQKSNPRN